jgi:Rieske Fe-S protein
LSDNHEDNKKKEQSKTQSQDSSAPETTEQKTTSEGEKKPAISRPVIGTPIGTRPVVGMPVGTRPIVGTPATRPVVGTPAGSEPTVGTPVAARPVVGTPRPTVGSPAGTTPPPRPTVGAARPGIGSPSVPGRPTIPQKPTESRKEITRRQFLVGLLAVGGIALLGYPFAYPVGAFLQGSVSGSGGYPRQQVIGTNGTPLKTTDIVTNNGQAMTLDDVAKGGAWQTFIYPFTGNIDTDADTFHQCVLIRLPKDLIAPSESFPYATKDPLINTYSTPIGDTFVALSRVCVHLWCLWSYHPEFSSTENEYVRRGICPCHGSEYVPGYGQYSGFPTATDKLPGHAVGGPAFLQSPPNNALPLVQLDVDSSGNLYATGIVGQIGYCQVC